MVNTFWDLLFDLKSTKFRFVRKNFKQKLPFLKKFKDFYPNRQQLILHKRRKRGFTKGLHNKVFVTKFTHKSERNKEIVWIPDSKISLARPTRTRPPSIPPSKASAILWMPWWPPRALRPPPAPRLPAGSGDLFPIRGFWFAPWSRPSRNCSKNFQ